MTDTPPKPDPTPKPVVPPPGNQPPRPAGKMPDSPPAKPSPPVQAAVPPRPNAANPASAVPPGPARPATGSGAQPAPHRRTAGPVLTALGFVLLAGGLAWVWTEQQRLVVPLADDGRVTALEVQVRGLQKRLVELEQRPAPDLQPLATRLAALERQQKAMAAQEPQQQDLTALTNRVTALEQRPAAGPTIEPALQSAVTALQQRVAQAEQAQGATAARAARLARLQAASAALNAGQPLGNIPDAPPALARFATVSPPTEAALRLDFDAAARRAARASQPVTASETLVQRMWSRVQSMVTVRDGDRVLSGAPATVVLGLAREQLNAGNLAGAVAALERLDPAALAAMADWNASAHALLDARAALAKLMAAD